MSTKATLSLPSSAGQGRENITSAWWVEMRTGENHSAVTATGKTDLTWGNWPNILLDKEYLSNYESYITRHEPYKSSWDLEWTTQGAEWSG